MSEADRQKLEVDAQNWLHNTLNRVSQEVNCSRVQQITQPPEDMATEMVAFLQHSQGVFYKGMNRHLYLQQKEFLVQF